MALWLWLGGLTRENATGRRTGDSSGGLGGVVSCIQFWGAAPAAQESPSHRSGPKGSCSQVRALAKRGASVDVPVNTYMEHSSRSPHCVNRLASLSTKPENTQPTPQLTLITTYLLNLTPINPLPVEWFTPVECDAVAMFLCGRSPSGQRGERTR